MACRVGIDAQRLARVAEPVVQQFPAERENALVLSREFVRRRHGKVEVQLLRDVVFGPRGRSLLRLLLEGEAEVPGSAAQDKPVGAARIRFAEGRRLIAWPVLQSEQLPVELGEPARVSGVEHHLAKSGDRDGRWHGPRLDRIRTICRTARP